MKSWIFGRRLMDEQPSPTGEGAGGGKSEEGGGTGEETKGGEPPVSQDSHDSHDPGGEEEHPNALGEDLEKGDQSGASADKPKGDQQPNDKPTGDEPTEAEVKAYRDALKLDEATFGKDVKFDERYLEKMPALFKKHGLDPEKANALANDFTKLQKEIAKDTTDNLVKFREWRAAEIKRMNEEYLATYDKAGREDIVRAMREYVPKYIKDKDGKERLSPLYMAVTMTEVGVDPGFLKAMKFIGERLAKDAAPGAASGMGSGGGKSLSDSFMGL